MRKIIIASVAAIGLASTPAIAQSTVGGGTSASGPEGSVAGGATAGRASNPDKAHKRHREMRRDQRRSQRDRQTPSNSASTYGSGTIYTDRNRATGGVTAGGSASGTGSQSSSTAIDAYGSTTRNGSEAEIYGDATAESRDRR